MARLAFLTMMLVFVATASSLRCKTTKRPVLTPPTPPQCSRDIKYSLDKVSKYKYLIQLHLEPRLEGALFDLNLMKEKCILRMRGNEETHKPYFVLIKKGIVVKRLEFPQMGSRMNLTFGRGELVINSPGNTINYDLRSLLKQCGMGQHGILGNLVGGIIGGILGALESLFGAPLFHLNSKFASGVGVCIIKVTKL